MNIFNTAIQIRLLVIFDYLLIIIISYGTFIKWAESIGIKKASAYNYMNIYKAFQNLESIKKQETFLSQPKSIQYEMAKPSANEDVNKAVFEGSVICI